MADREKGKREEAAFRLTSLGRFDTPLGLILFLVPTLLPIP